MFKQVAIIGGGLAGLISGILLSKKGVPCILFEKKDYPYPKVCGEYVGNEATDFLKTHGLYPSHLSPTQIKTLQISTVRGQSATLPLDMGGFGISRFSFDTFLAEKAKDAGVTLRTNTEVTGVTFKHNQFFIQTTSDEIKADVVIGAFGKRSKLDATLKRGFIQKRSPYVGVKYHVRSNHPDGVIALHNFPGGYCGVVNVEDGRTNLCYLIHRDLVQQYKSIEETEKNVLFKNQPLKTLFETADFLHSKPLVINEISFQKKETVFNHILMTGDSAGMITPLCGNGMAMAIHAGKLAAEIVEPFYNEKISRDKMEASYSNEWNRHFANRLWFGRSMQTLYNLPFFADLTIGCMNRSSKLASMIVRSTHGSTF